MENILIGLDLEEYKDTFNMHKIGVEEFLTLSEESMISMGLEKVGARSRLLEGQVEAHKRTWEKGSMPRLRLTDKKAGLRLTCPDAAGVLGNLSNHSSYLRASVAYIREENINELLFCILYTFTYCNLHCCLLFNVLSILSPCQTKDIASLKFSVLTLNLFFLYCFL